MTTLTKRLLTVLSRTESRASRLGICLTALGSALAWTGVMLARLFAEGTLMRGPRRDRVTCRSRSHSTTCFTRTPHATDRPHRANEAQADEQKDLLPATQGHVDRAG